MNVTSRGEKGGGRRKHTRKESSNEKRNDRYFFSSTKREMSLSSLSLPRRRRSRSSILVPIVIIIGSSIIRARRREERLLYDDDVTTLYKILLFVIPAVVYPRSSLPLAHSLLGRPLVAACILFLFFFLFFTCLFRSPPTLSLGPRPRGLVRYSVSPIPVWRFFSVVHAVRSPSDSLSLSLSFSVLRGG